jgi:hypothetical protein
MCSSLAQDKKCINNFGEETSQKQPLERSQWRWEDDVNHLYDIIETNLTPHSCSNNNTEKASTLSCFSVFSYVDLCHLWPATYIFGICLWEIYIHQGKSSISVDKNYFGTMVHNYCMTIFIQFNLNLTSLIQQT